MDLEDVYKSTGQIIPVDTDVVARDIVDKKIFGTIHISPHLYEELIPRIFLPIKGGALKMIPDDDVKAIGMIFEYISLSIGCIVHEGKKYPVFQSMRVVSRDHKKKIREEVERLRKEV